METKYLKLWMVFAGIFAITFFITNIGIMTKNWTLVHISFPIEILSLLACVVCLIKRDFF